VNLAKFAYSVETVFKVDQANGPERSGEAFQKCKPFENQNNEEHNVNT